MTVSHLHPTADWPNVACVDCHTIYEVNTDTEGFIVGKCPRCSSVKFNTTMRTGELTNVQGRESA